jgi:GxxExxY protein
MPLRLPSPLSQSTELIVTQTIDSALAVHRHLGPGLLEAIYADAMAIELDYRGLKVERQRQVILYFRDRPLRQHRLDMVIAGEVLVELKAVDRLHPVHHAQVLTYLRASRLKIGLLINFKAVLLKGNIKRVILTDP